MSSKKLINVPREVVDDSLRGLVAVNQNIALLPKCRRVVLRRELMPNEVSSEHDEQVRLLSGGGSGHEPFSAGFVGRGMLSGAVCGHVFSSPPSNHISAALHALNSKGGLIVFVINYTGDRLNFGLAIERERQKCSGPIRSVVIGEDTALTSSDRSAGRRGLAGCLFVFKIAGAMADLKAFSMDEIADCAEQVAKNCGTIGLSLSSCSLPGQSPVFELSETEMELGLGIHGEPGIQRVALKCARETVDTMLSHMTSQTSANSLSVSRGDNVAILLNNLGGLSQLEMNIVAAEVIAWMNRQGIVVHRFYSGTLMTSLDMRGCSISVLRLTPKWIAYLDAPTDAMGWPRQLEMSSEEYVAPDIRLDETASASQSVDLSIGPAVDPETSRRVEHCLLKIVEVLIGAERELNELDSIAGDGDCGSTFRTMAQAIQSAMAKGAFQYDTPCFLLQQLSSVVEEHTGGTTGAIYAILLSAGAQSLKEGVTGRHWVEALESGLNAVMKYGRAQVQDRTMVDALDATVKSLKSAPNLDKQTFENAVSATEEAVNATTYMRAKAGRASYTAPENQTRPDPGARALALWIAALYDAYFQ